MCLSERAYRPGRAEHAHGPTDTDIQHEGSCGRRWYRSHAHGQLVRTEHRVGTDLVGSNPANWYRGGGIRSLDFVVPPSHPETAPPYLLGEVKRYFTSGALDAVVGSLVLERALLEEVHDLAPADIAPVAVFDGAAFGPDTIPPTVEVYARACDRLGITMEVATGEGRFWNLNRHAIR